MTISFNHLGNLGHLGNQMFQYAALIGLGKKHNRQFCIPHRDAFGKAYYQELRSNLDDAFNIDCPRGLSKFKTIQEGSFHFDRQLFEHPPSPECNLYGFFQSEKWFKHAEEEVRKAFTFKDEYRELAQLMRDQLSGEIVALHVRRTDYMTNPNHYALGLDYYERALARTPEKTVIIFTDDVEWAKGQELFPDDRFFVSETDCAYTDMCLMSLCDYHIIGNSTFSWWGAWLADSKQVIAPHQWFDGDLKTNKLDDLYLDSWIVL